MTSTTSTDASQQQRIPDMTLNESIETGHTPRGAEPKLDPGEPTTEPTPSSGGIFKSFGFGLDKFSGLYVWALLIIVFSLWIPHLFLNVQNFRIVASSQAVGAILALGLLVPVACGVFDLSIAGTMAVAETTVIYMQGHHHGTFVGIVVALAMGLAVGLVNSFVVLKLHVDSFIGTLGMSSILAALVLAITNGAYISAPASNAFSGFGQNKLWGLPLPVFYMFGIGLVLWWLLEYTPIGRYLYGIGGNPQAARLAGVRVNRITTGAFLCSGVIAAFAGIVLSAELGSGSPGIADPYLLPAFSAVFLGATQIRPGRVNVLGTLIAIFLLATGVKGLQLAGAPDYISQLFNGAALIIAVALAARTAHRRRKSTT
jgi:ribose transport system permease protein